MRGGGDIFEKDKKAAGLECYLNLFSPPTASFFSLKPSLALFIALCRSPTGGDISRPD